MENNNSIDNQGNNNIIIQGVTDSTITLEVNGATQEIQNELCVLRELLEQMNAQQVEMNNQIYDLTQLGQADIGVKKTFNALMTKGLTTALGNHGHPICSQFVTRVPKGWENNTQFSEPAKSLITTAFVGVLGIQLRKIMAIGKEPLSPKKELNYIENGYIMALKTTQLLVFVYLSSFWDEKEKAHYALEPNEDALLRDFFTGFFEWNLGDYIELLPVLINLFKRYDLPFPLLEMEHFDLEKVCKTGHRIQKLKNKLDESKASLMTCFEMEAQLTRLLEHFVFFMNYKMFSVKSVSYDAIRITNPHYIHHFIELGVDQKYNENTEKIEIINEGIMTDSVLLYNTKNNYHQNINLTPFIVDYNTLTFEQGAKICFYSGRNMMNQSLNYRFLKDNQIQNIEFKDILNDGTQKDDLLKNRNDYKVLRLDNITDQFTSAMNIILK